MGQIRKEGNSWYFVAELGRDPLTGARKRKKKRGFKTKREAEKALATLEAEVIKGEYIEPDNTLYKDYLAEWYKGKKAVINTQTSKAYDSYMENHILPPLGSISLSKLNPLIVQNFVHNLRDNGLSSATIKKVYTIVNNSLEHARRLELISKNPAANVQLPKVEKKEMSVWNVDNITAFLNAARVDRTYSAFYLAISTGMRQGEILGLRWKDVDLEQGYIYITQTLSHDGKEFLVGAKTISSIRSIKIDGDTVRVLRKQRAVIVSEKLELGKEYKDYDLVVCTSFGTPILPSNLNRTYRRLRKLADVPPIRFHDLRHTHASLLLSIGVPAKVIAERLGHANIKTTLDIYTHVFPSMQDEAAEKIEKMLANNK